MKSGDEHHRLGVHFFEQRNYERAVEEFRIALGTEESADFWSDWAAAKFALGVLEEAEEGFRLALEIEPSHADALVNLGVLLLQQRRESESTPFLERAAEHAEPSQKQDVESLLAQARKEEKEEKEVPAKEWEEYLRGFLRDDENERSYFDTHLKRYLETLRLLPEGSSSARILELGTAFHHLTPALLQLKNYGEVRCNDIWQGDAQQRRHVQSKSGEAFEFIVDNFDVQKTRWPYEEASFDAVLCCEMLEHLHTDPMALLSEINRILKSGGHLLLTTPNVACCHSVAFALRGESPYVYGKFERGGAPTDRHNREYTAGEVERLACFSGFQIEQLKTRDSWWPRSRQVLWQLAAQGHSIARRGDNTFLLARKEGPVAARYPEEFYQSHGTQSDRRAVQGEQHRESQVLAEELEPQKILVIHELLPHFDRSGSDLRLLDVLHELRAQGHSVTYIGRDGANYEQYQKPLEQLGIKVFSHDPERLRHMGKDGRAQWSFEEILIREKFDLAILCEWFWSGISIPEHYLDEIREISPATRIAILTDDRHGERERRASVASGLFTDYERGNDFESRELEACRRADLVLYITEPDQRHFWNLLPDLRAELLPMVAKLPRTGPPFEERDGVLFLGNFDNPANRDALEWMMKEIWPRVWHKNPELKLYVAGHGAPDAVANDHTGIVRLGHVKNLADAFAARLVFAGPIRFGTGINTKNLQALAHGLPVVTTAIGAEGLQLEHDKQALIANDAASFAAQILRVASDRELWNGLAANGRDYLAARFSVETSRLQVRKILGRAKEVHPRAASSEEWSYCKVEKAIPATLTARPARYRLVLRTLGYWQLGTKLAKEGRTREALEQFRHVFTAMRGAMPATVFHRRLLADMHAAYLASNDSKGAARCKHELGNLVSLESQNLRTTTASVVSAKGKAVRPKISVILPTYNRKEILSICLAALAFQTLRASLYEVIVVDDGSTDGTEEFCLNAELPFPLQYIRQTNSGAGAARRNGVEAARGEFMLFCNDDTIASSTLLSEHLHAHLNHPRKKLAVLGEFQPSELCAERALSLWVNVSPFFFPQQSLKAGQICNSSYFVTCNLSIRSDAVLAAGNFDSSFRVAEDTELGARLEKSGYRVCYHPAAKATHEHARFTAGDLLQRAKLYGAADWHLFQKHPQLIASGQSHFGKLAEQDFERIEKSLKENRSTVQEGICALEALDKIDFLPLFQLKKDGETAAQEILKKLTQLVPLIYWHTLFESFLAEREKTKCAEIAVGATESSA